MFLVIMLCVITYNVVSHNIQFPYDFQDIYSCLLKFMFTDSDFEIYLFEQRMVI